jgi:hypothetical protein
MTTKEQRAIMWEMYHQIDECEDVCEKCPLRHICGKEELFFGCPVWEDEMGEDL